MNKRRIVVVVLLICVVVVAVLALTATAVVILLVGPYAESDSAVMIAHLERKYNVIVPKAGCEIRAARTWSIPVRGDDAESFLLRIDGEPNMVIGFARTYCNFDGLRQHYPNDETDIRDIGFHVPAWFKAPIQVGKLGTASWTDSDTGRVLTARVYVDTTRPDMTTLYLKGYYSTPAR